MDWSGTAQNQENFGAVTGLLLVTLVVRTRSYEMIHTVHIPTTYIHEVMNA